MNEILRINGVVYHRSVLTVEKLIHLGLSDFEIAELGFRIIKKKEKKEQKKETKDFQIDEEKEETRPTGTKRTKEIKHKRADK